MIFCLMQNAYAFHLHRLPFEKLLLSGRWWYPHSRAGARLRILLPEIWCPEYVYFFNTTWKVGLKASDKYPPDFDYVRKWVDKLTPDVVVATGKQAEEVATEVWSGSLVVTPHPTYRCLTNRLYRMASRTVHRLNTSGYEVERWTFIQRVGYHEAIKTDG